MKRIVGTAAALAVVGFGSAAAVNRVAAAWIAPETPVDDAGAGATEEGDMPRSVAAGRSPPVPTGRPVRIYVESILKHNAFDTVAAAAWQPKAGGADGGPIASDLRVKLLGTIVARPEAFSSALILDEADSTSRGYGLGDKLYDAEVIRIEARRVTVRRGDGTEQVLALGESEAPKPVTTSTATTEGGTEEGITKVSDTEFTITRETVEKYLSDIEGLSKLGRGLLHRGPDGGFDGYRLTAIRRNSLAEQLGIQNGDVIHSINGQPLNSVQAAMNAYNSMGSSSNFALEVTRRGEKTNLSYNIQ